MPPSADPDPLRDLRERLQATQDAAARLAADAARARAAQEASRVPPAGWATAQERASLRGELEEIAALLTALRALVPAELQHQVAEVLKQVLLLLRALLDWWLARLDEVAATGDGAGAGGAHGGDAAARPVGEDIPVT
jgi:hypothetical protein